MKITKHIIANAGPHTVPDSRFVNITPTAIVSETALRGPDGTLNPIETLKALQDLHSQDAQTEPRYPDWQVDGGYHSESSLLLMEYREHIWKAYELGMIVKKLYGIIPPKVHYSGVTPAVVLGLTVN
jgi:hypothetical protein